MIKRIIFREKASSETFVNYLRSIGAQIGENSFFYDVRSNYVGLNNPFNLRIGDNVQITHGVTILDHGYDWSVAKCKYGLVLGNTGQIDIGSNVFIGANSVILPNVHVGNNVIIGAGSIVNSDIPSDSVAVGNPCKVVKSLKQYVEKKRESQLQEAFNLFKRYYEVYKQLPPKEIFREYFWIFTDKDSRLNSAFYEVNQLIPDSRLITENMFSKNVPFFKSYGEFMDWCMSGGTK